MSEHLKEDRFQHFFFIFESNAGHAIQQKVKDFDEKREGDAILIESPDETDTFGDG